jgi:NADH-quinone oxidoreductase subunit J
VIQVIFLLFAATALGSAINVLVQRHVLYSALSLIVMLGSTAGLFVLLGAEMIAAVQILVYAGAIMVLFIFVIMLLNVNSDPETRDPLWWVRLVGIPAGLFFLSLMSAAVWQPATQGARTAVVTGGPREIGASLFTVFVLPFEATSILILIAIVGALVLAKREL